MMPTSDYERTIVGLSGTQLSLLWLTPIAVSVQQLSSCLACSCCDDDEISLTAQAFGPSVSPPISNSKALQPWWPPRRKVSSVHNPFIFGGWIPWFQTSARVWMKNGAALL